MNMLSGLDFKLKNPFKDPDRVADVHAKVEKLVDRERPNPEEFRGIISDAQIDKDIARVKELEKMWASVNDEEDLAVKQKADIAEYIIYKNLGTWMDQKAVALITAKADDYIRGIDLVIESEPKEESKEQGDINHLGIGIDIALTSDKSASISAEKKKEKIRKMLREGTLAEAFYVSGGSWEGKIEDLAYTVIFVSPKHIENLFPSVLKTGSSEREKNHLMKYVVAYQIARLLMTCYQVSSHRNRPTLALKYGKANNFAYEVFDHLLNEVNENADLKQQVTEDSGVQEMEKFCADLLKDLT